MCCYEDLPEVEWFFQWIPRLCHERRQEASEASVDVHRDPSVLGQPQLGDGLHVVEAAVRVLRTRGHQHHRVGVDRLWAK